MAGKAAPRNDRLAWLMAEAGFDSHKAFARAVRTVSEEPQVGRPIGCDHTSVSRWLRGMQPRADTAACITTVLSRALGRPVSLAEAGFSASAVVPPDLGLDAPAVGEDGTVILESLLRADLDEAAAVVARPASPAAWQLVPLTWLVTRQEPQAGSQRDSPRVGTADVARVRAATALFSELDNRFGGGHARRALIQYLADDVARLLHGRCRDATAGALLSAAGEATLLAAWMSYDTGLHGLAQRYFIQALGLAEAGGNRLLAGSILDAMSHQATYLGKFRDAANLARAARAGTGRLATPSLTAHFHAMEARALAGLGDKRGCELALAGAVTLFERRNPDNEPEWFRYFDDAELAAEFAHCYRDIHRPDRAADYAAQSLDGACGTRSDFFVTMVLANAHLQAGDADQACRVALDAVTLGEPIKSARCARYLHDFDTVIASAVKSSAAREFRVEPRRYSCRCVNGSDGADDRQRKRLLNRGDDLV